MAAAGMQYWVGRLARSTDGYVLLAEEGRFRLAACAGLSDFEEQEAIVWGKQEGDSIRVAEVAEMLSGRELAEAALFIIRKHRRGAHAHAAARLEDARRCGSVRDIEIWRSILSRIQGERLDGNGWATLAK